MISSLQGTGRWTATSVGFAALHDLLISDTWFSLPSMMMAGAVCGLCLAWSYHVVFRTVTPVGWLLYNLEFVVLFFVLGGLSFLVFEPIYTIPGLAAGVESPDALLGQAIPLSAAFGLVAGVALSLLRGRTVGKATSIIATSVTLTVLLGHNAAVLGMPHMTREALPLVAEFHGLMAAVMVGNAALFVVLERRGLFAGAPGNGAEDPGDPSPHRLT